MAASSPSPAVLMLTDVRLSVVDVDDHFSSDAPVERTLADLRFVPAACKAAHADVLERAGTCTNVHVLWDN